VSCLRETVGSEQPLFYPKPPVPYTTANSSRSSHGSTVPSSSRSAAAAAGTSPHADSDDVSRQNPLAAFDSRDVSLITVNIFISRNRLIYLFIYFNNPHYNNKVRK